MLLLSKDMYTLSSKILQMSISAGDFFLCTAHKLTHLILCSYVQIYSTHLPQSRLELVMQYFISGRGYNVNEMQRQLQACYQITSVKYVHFCMYPVCYVVLTVNVLWN